MKLKSAGRYEVLFTPDGGLYMIPSKHIFAAGCDEKVLLVVASNVLHIISNHTFVSIEGHERFLTDVDVLVDDYLDDMSQVRAICSPRRYRVVMETGLYADLVDEDGQLWDSTTHEELRASQGMDPSDREYWDVCDRKCITIDEKATLDANEWAPQDVHYAALMALRTQWKTTPLFVSQYRREMKERGRENLRQRRRRERVTNP